MLQIRVLQNTRLSKTKKKGLEEHYQLLIELTPRDHKLTCLDIEVDARIKNSSAVSIGKTMFIGINYSDEIPKK
jgi:hypothetical protein